MKPKTKALLGSVSLRQLLLSFKPLQPVNQLSQLSMKTQCVLFLPVSIKDKGIAEGHASLMRPSSTERLGQAEKSHSYPKDHCFIVNSVGVTHYK